MKLAHARKILKNFSLDKLLLSADLQPAELNIRLRLRQSAIELLMQEGNADRLSASCVLDKILRYYRANIRHAKNLNRHVWRRCAVCNRPIYTTTRHPKSYCKLHAHANRIITRQRCYQNRRRTKYIRKRDMSQPEQPLPPEIEQYLAQTVTLDLLRRISTAKAGQDLQAYRQAVAEVSAALIARFACDPQEAAWIAAQVIINRERELWVQLKLL